MKILFKKECLESWRSFKFLWIPLVFIFLGVAEPLTNYYMEDILSAVGNMPEGFQMVMPELTAVDIVASITGQYQLIGLIVLISAFIGTVSRERQNGTATLLYVRPISATAVWISKWLSASFIGMFSAILGYIVSMYYISILYGSVPLVDLIKMLVTYCLWLLFVMAVTVAMSAAFQTGVAAAIAIILLPIGLLIDSAIGGFWIWTPWKLANYAIGFLDGTVEKSDFLCTVGVTSSSLLCFLIIGIAATKYNWQRTKV